MDDRSTPSTAIAQGRIERISRSSRSGGIFSVRQGRLGSRRSKASDNASSSARIASCGSRRTGPARCTAT